MEKLTRYKLKVRYGKEDGFYAVGVVRQEGEWVKFSDIKELLQTATNSAMPKLPSSTEVWKMVVDLCADKKLFCEVEAARAISEAVYKFIYRQLRQ